MNTFTLNYKKKMRHLNSDLVDTEKDRLSQMVDALNKLLIFQTNFEMNNKYDANGFSDLINQIKIEPSIERLKEECASYGGSPEEFKRMTRLEFHPFDEF